MALCVRFVDEHQNIREEFLQFSKPLRTTGYHLAEEIKSALQELGIKLGNMRGQGYDGAASMSSTCVGVQARIMQDAPKAFYIHCSGHCLNLLNLLGLFPAIICNKDISINGAVDIFTKMTYLPQN